MELNVFNAVENNGFEVFDSGPLFMLGSVEGKVEDAHSGEAEGTH